jgi:hypothetical protein
LTALKVTEHEEQCALVAWFKIQHRKLDGHLMSIPNGAILGGDARLRSIQMNKLKAEGLLTGAADLFLMVPIGTYHGMFIEMKSKSGKLSEDQKSFLGAAQLMGYFCVVCFSFEEAKNAITNYLGARA